MQDRYYKYIVIGILVLLSVVVLLRPYVAGVDTYYFLNHVCNGNVIDAPIVAQYIFDMIPCNTLLIKLIQIGLLLSFLGGMYAISTLYVEKGKPLSKFVLLIFSSIYIFSEFLGNLEDDQFAYPILALSVYFFIKFIKNKKWMDYVISMFAVGIACLIWKGAILYLLVYGFASIYYFIPFALFVVITQFPLLSYAGYLKPNFLVMENMPIIAIVYIFIAIIGIFIFKSDEPLSIKLATGYLLAIALLNAKYGFHVVPFLVIGIYKYITHIKGNKERETKFIMFWILLCVAVIVSCGAIFVSMPTNDTFNSINESVLMQEDYNMLLTNDWSLGYYIWYHTGQEPSYYGSPKEEYDFNNKLVIVGNWTDYDLNYCNEIKKWEKTTLYKCGGEEE